MAENIIPVMLNKVNTSKALQCQDTTIKTLTTHIVEKSFTKLEETLFILKEKKWDRFELLDLVRKSLPDIQIIISLLGIESRKIGMTLLSLYQAYFPDWVRSSRFDVGKCLEYTSDPQLVEPVLNFLIHFPGFKWYSLNDNSSHLKTIMMLKDASPKVRKVVESLFESSFLFPFQDEIPILLDVIESFENHNSFPAIIDFVDKNLSHMARNPLETYQSESSISPGHLIYRKALLKIKSNLPNSTFNDYHYVFVKNATEETSLFVVRLLQSIFYFTQSNDAMKSLTTIQNDSYQLHLHLESFSSACLNLDLSINDHIEHDEERMKSIVYHRFRNLDTENLPSDVRVINSLLKLRASNVDYGISMLLESEWTNMTLIRDRLMMIKCLIREIGYLHRNKLDYSLQSAILQSCIQSGNIAKEDMSVLLEHPFIRSQFMNLNMQTIKLVVNVLKSLNIESKFYLDILMQKIQSDLKAKKKCSVLDLMIDLEALCVFNFEVYVSIMEASLKCDGMNLGLISYGLTKELMIPNSLATQMIPFILSDSNLENSIKLVPFSPFYSAFTDEHFDTLITSMTPHRSKLISKLLDENRLCKIPMIKVDDLSWETCVSLISHLVEIDINLAKPFILKKVHNLVDCILEVLTSSTTSLECQIVCEKVSKLLKIHEFEKIFANEFEEKMDQVEAIKNTSILSFSTQIIGSNYSVKNLSKLYFLSLTSQVNFVKKNYCLGNDTKNESYLELIIVQLVDLINSGISLRSNLNYLKGTIVAVLRHRFMESKFSHLLPLLVKLCIFEGVFATHDLLNMIKTHSQFDECMFDQSPEKVMIVHDSKVMLVSVFKELSSHDTCRTLVFELLAKGYNGSMHSSDRSILQLFEEYETSFKSSVAGLLIDNFPKLGPTQFPHDAFDASRMETSITWFELEDQYIQLNSSPLQTLYDPKFVLSILLHTLLNKSFAEKLDLRSLFENRMISLAIMCLSSNNTDIRNTAYFVLDVIYTRVKYLPYEILREKSQLLVLFNNLKNSIVNRSETPRISTIVTLFFARSLMIILSPEDMMYPIVNKCYLQRPQFDIEDIPIFYDTFYSYSDTSNKERKWLMSIITNSIKSAEDYKVFKRRYVLESMISYFTSPLSDDESKQSILTFFCIASSIPTVCANMICNLGLVQLFYTYFDHLNFETDQMITRFGIESLVSVFNGWLAIEETWHGKGGKQVWLNLFILVFNCLCLKVTSMQTPNKYFIQSVLLFGVKIQSVGSVLVENDTIEKFIEIGECSNVLFKLVVGIDTVIQNSSIIKWAYTIAFDMYSNDQDITNWFTFMSLNSCAFESKEMENLMWRVKLKIDQSDDTKMIDNLKRKSNSDFEQNEFIKR